MKTLNVYSIFTSIDGEVSGFGQGRLSTFIRLAGCNLNCSYCDTKRARDTKYGEITTINEIIEVVKQRKVNKVTITGGEPLLQNDVFELTKRLYDEEIDVSIETNGSIVPFGYCVGSFVVDYKLPSSGMNEHMVSDAFTGLRKCDFIKFVIKDTYDFDFAIKFYKEIREINKDVKFAFSPLSNGKLNAVNLLNELLLDGIKDAYINVQIHKLLHLE